MLKREHLMLFHIAWNIFSFSSWWNILLYLGYYKCCPLTIIANCVINTQVVIFLPSEPSKREMCSLKGPFLFIFLSITFNSLEATPVERSVTIAHTLLLQGEIIVQLLAYTGYTVK